MHINNLQRSVNDMEELVAIHDEAIGIADAPDAQAIDIQGGRIVFDEVTFHYGGHCAPLYDGLSVDIRAGERVGLVGRSGSGKTTFVKLVQRLYDVSGGRILMDGQDIADATQQSLRSQIAIVQQDPILFHRSLAENIAYGRPGASMAAIEQRRGSPTRTSSSCGCRKATARWSANAASSCRAANGNASRWRARSWRTRRC
jgi:ATP-binding cassette, subfamily B, bacterial